MKRKEKVIYFIRHAEACHNIREREAMERVKRQGCDEAAQEAARKLVLQRESLRDAPLSESGHKQSKVVSKRIHVLHQVCSDKYPRPKIVLVSPLRRALMTATDLFFETSNNPNFVGLEIIREKRTGFAADERSSVEVLENEFPHVDFKDLHGQHEIPLQEDNAAVRLRCQDFLENVLPQMEQDSVAIVTHKGWLREMQHTFLSYVEAGQLKVDFDLEQWHQTQYKNAEIRVAKFVWEDGALVSIVSRSVENALGSVIEETAKKMVGKNMRRLGLKKSYSEKNESPICVAILEEVERLPQLPTDSSTNHEEEG
jgi:broad specificity phosphatase PhoE